MRIIDVSDGIDKTYRYDTILKYLRIEDLNFMAIARSSGIASFLTMKAKPVNQFGNSLELQVHTILVKDPNFRVISQYSSQIMG